MIVSWIEVFFSKRFYRKKILGNWFGNFFVVGWLSENLEQSLLLSCVNSFNHVAQVQFRSPITRLMKRGKKFAAIKLSIGLDDNWRALVSMINLLYQE